ncbi:creatininase family protein, partial [Phyllobacterium calauticae]
ATAEAGEQIIARSVQGIIELLEDVDRFDVSVLRP